MRVMQSKFTKTNQKKYFQTGERAPGAPVLDPPLSCIIQCTTGGCLGARVRDAKFKRSGSYYGTCLSSGFWLIIRYKILNKSFF